MIEVYDLECLRNVFTYTGYDYKNDKWYQFVISPWRNDILALLIHLQNVKLMIGYNNLAYDSPLLHHILRHANEYQYVNGTMLSQKLYVKSQKIIDSEFSELSEENTIIKQLDLYKIMGYDNKAARTSLKDLEIAMRLENVEEMPIHHSTYCTEDDIDKILSYNKNDVYATYRFLLIVLGKTDNPLYAGDNRIDLRRKLQSKFNINVLNTPDIRIGEKMMLKLYCDATGKNQYVIKKCGGTPRNQICLKDCIPHWANFQTPEFQQVKRNFEETIVDGSNLKDAFSFSCMFHGIRIDYGLGGCHSSCKPGVYEADDEIMILDEDIGLALEAQVKLLKLLERPLSVLSYNIISNYKCECLKINIIG